MIMLRIRVVTQLAGLLAAGGLALAPAPDVAAAPVVPGTGQLVPQVGDDFEDESWSYVFNSPKSTEENNERQNPPGGRSQNGRMYEGSKRGNPDVVRRVATPPDGLPGSQGALLLQSLQTGIPGSPSYTMQQDDICCDIHYRLGGSIPVHQTPSFVTRVYLPPLDKWERRAGPHFGFRASCDTHTYKAGKGFFSSGGMTRETYWPGMFIELYPKSSRQPEDTISLRVRGHQSRGDYTAMKMEQTGWWTLGMSFTPDGQVHYYVRQGVDDLTAEDHIASEYPYGYRCERVSTCFFNICNGDNGRTWSTPFTVDDTRLYYIPTTQSRMADGGQRSSATKER